MRVAAVQLEPIFGDLKGNVEKAISLIDGQNADLFVLPELCFSGYSFTSRDEAFDLAENPDNCFSMEQMRALASKLDAGIIYGFPERSGDRIYNSCVFVPPNGKIEIYRKLHLYYYEKEWFTLGDKALNVFEFRDCKIGMMICFDWFFPEVARTLALRGANLICHPANLVMSYCQRSMKVRSLENVVYTITSNRIGRENRGDFDFEFTGGTQILDIRGEILFQASTDKVEIGIADIDINRSKDKNVNEKNNLFTDRRTEYYRQVDDV